MFSRSPHIYSKFTPQTHNIAAFIFVSISSGPQFGQMRPPKKHNFWSCNSPTSPHSALLQIDTRDRGMAGSSQHSTAAGRSWLWSQRSSESFHWAWMNPGWLKCILNNTIPPIPPLPALPFIYISHVHHIHSTFWSWSIHDHPPNWDCSQQKEERKASKTPVRLLTPFKWAEH